jgi:hypothetical protein
VVAAHHHAQRSPGAGRGSATALRDAVGAELDAIGGSFEYLYETVLVTATRA